MAIDWIQPIGCGGALMDVAVVAQPTKKGLTSL
jgi:hypothetical protein